MASSIFEDSLHPLVRDKDTGMFVLNTKEYIVISNMLKNKLTTPMVDVYFTNSSSNITRALQSLNSIAIIYYDLVFDNHNTIQRCTDILNFIVYNNIDKAILVPIHCIEWHCIKALGKHCELRDIAIYLSDYKNTDIYKYNMNKKKASHEKFCKAVFGEVIDRKFHGSCRKEDYSISEDEETALVDTLPLVFEGQRSNTKKINLADELEKLYNKYLNLLTCNEELIRKFKVAYISYIDFIRKLYN